VVDNGDGVDAGEDEVLCDFVREGLDTDEEDVCFANTVVELVATRPKSILHHQCRETPCA
jgi:hypothetical protein